jgi:hypothetical protein
MNEIEKKIPIIIPTVTKVRSPKTIFIAGAIRSNVNVKFNSLSLSLLLRFASL